MFSAGRDAENLFLICLKAVSQTLTFSRAHVFCAHDALMACRASWTSENISSAMAVHTRLRGARPNLPCQYIGRVLAKQLIMNAVPNHMEPFVLFSSKRFNPFQRKAFQYTADDLSRRFRYFLICVSAVIPDCLRHIDRIENMLSSGSIADLNPAECPASFKYRSPSFSQLATLKNRNPIMFLRKRNVFWHHSSVYRDHIRQQKTP